MKWLNLDSLRKRYASLTILLAIIMFSFSWLAQKQMNGIKKDIHTNIESRNLLFQQNREFRSTISKFRDLLAKFQIDPKSFEDREVISLRIAQAVKQIEHLAEHPWIKENYATTAFELILTLHDFDEIANRLIQIRLTPTDVFPSLKIANTKMQPHNATFIQNINLAIKELEDNYTPKDYNEYKLLVNLRTKWIVMISGFRMYLLNQLNSFREKFLINQLNRIKGLEKNIISDLNILKKLNKKDKLNFTTSIALDEMYPAAMQWMKEFKIVRKINKSDDWRMDTIVYRNELEPKIQKINALLHNLDLGIERFSENDLDTLSNIAQLQVNSIWAAAIVGMFVLLVGFIFLVKLILNPIATVTHALKDESKGIETTLQPNFSILETKNLITAFKEMRRQIHTRQEELEYHALHDDLTGLANRALLIDRLEQSIHNAKQERSSFSVLIMDLDRFKEVNDTLGHAVGDKLLQQVAKRLTNLLREVDVIVRLGGDEFAVLLTTAQEKHANIIAKKIINEFQRVFTVDKTPLYIGISIGISVFPQHGLTAQILQQRADVAMYVAKRNKTGYEIYDQKYDEYSVGRLSLISDLRSAIDQQQLFMEYQPIIDIKTGKVISAEALLRWNHPERGKVFPDDIIPMAEQTGLINPITYWILDTTAKYNKRLKANGIDLKIAINLSVYNLQETDFVENIVAIYEQNDIAASNFIMEVTESVMMTNPKKSINVLKQIDKLGIEIAVDDFGTGYSSLAYLKQLPLSKLKIDKSFIMDMIEDDNDAMIVRSTIDLAHNLGMQVVAEGIEEKEMLELLQVLGCEFGQGYYMSRPISEDDFEKWAIKQNTKTHI